jgi:UDP-2-acetamido-3-amino-2,3-dideoxy-glucuronate N-acetyltransferase
MLKYGLVSHPNVQIHESACVDEPCVIGEGTSIWHFTHIMPECRIGRSCRIGQNVFIASKVVLGNNVKVQNNVSIYTGVILEDDVFCGPSMVFTNIVTPRSEIVRRDQYKPTLIRRGASLGANCTVVCGIEIGRFAMIGAGAVLTKDVADYALMLGVPARPAGWVCRCGLTLEQSVPDRLVCAACGNVYRQQAASVVPIKEVQDRGT